nr:reverse transcriptase domain-containing protein [Tanacetum cinerariifolium]
MPKNHREQVQSSSITKQGNRCQSSGTLPRNTVTNPKEDLKGITTRSGAAYQGPTIPSSSSSTPLKVVNHETEVKKDMKTSIPFPSIRNDERRRKKANDQIEKFYEIIRDLSFEISFTGALTLMPKFASTLRTLMGNKENLSEMARTPLNENCSEIILNNLPKKLGDPVQFLIPSEFSGINTCNALADLGASINLMPHSIWKDLFFPKLTPTCMTLELADRSITEPIGLANDVYVTVGKFQFRADFVVVDFKLDPRVPLILGKSFLKTSHALIDVYQGEITLHVGKEAITFNLDQTSRYTANYDYMTANRIEVIDMACKEYSQEVLGFSNVITSGNPTPNFDSIVSTSSPTLTPFGDSDFFLFEKANSFLALEDDPTSSEVDDSYYDSEGNILLLEEILNNLKDEEKAALIKVLKSHKQAIAWKLSDIKGVDPEFCTNKILMEEDYEPTVHHQRRVNLKIHDVIKKEVEKLLDARLIYPISTSPWYLFAKKDAKARLMRWILLLQEFDIDIRDKKGAENLAADHLSRLENPHQDEFENREITETFLLETLGSIALRSDSTPSVMKCRKTPSKFAKSLTSGA